MRKYLLLGVPLAAAALVVSAAVAAELKSGPQVGGKIFISDRKLVKLYKLFRVRAWLFTGGTVSRDDLRLLAYLGETHQEIELLREKVPTLLGEA